MTDLNPILSGTGHYLPSGTIRSTDLENTLGLEEGWIEDRTGIRSRPVVDDETTGYMAIEAGKEALKNSNLSPDNIGLTILATSTPDQPLPPTAPAVQEALGVSGGGFDLAGSCVGFLDAISVGDKYIRSRAADHVLVIGSNHLTYRVNWDDPQTASLFADGAGAAILSSPEANPSTTPVPLKLQDIKTASDGSMHHSIEVPAGGSQEPFSPSAWEKNRHLMQMDDGRAVFKEAVKKQTEIASDLLEENGLGSKEIDWLLPHQANLRILEKVCDQLGLPRKALMCNIQTTGNTSAASIPILLDQALQSDQFSTGDTLLLTAFGSGLRYGAALLTC